MVVVCIIFFLLLAMAVATLPDFGAADSPTNNEVPARYVEQGPGETGVTNVVTGVILDYRAFDTFGETAVLLLALVAVLILLRQSPDEKAPVQKQALNNPVLQSTARLLLPLLLLYSVYVILNGHLSPGGGFSGGVILGASGILACLAFGTKTMHRIIPYSRFLLLSVAGMVVYCLTKLTVFLAGGLGKPLHLPLGELGSLFSGGLIPLLNLCVGLVVGCTLYGFFMLFAYRDI